MRCTFAFRFCNACTPRKESAREAIFGRHCDDFRNRAYSSPEISCVLTRHTLLINVAPEYVYEYIYIYITRIIQHSILSGWPITEYLPSVCILQFLIARYDRRDGNITRGARINSHSRLRFDAIPLDKYVSACCAYCNRVIYGVPLAPNVFDPVLFDSKIVY